MASSAQQDVLSGFFADHEIYAGNEAAEKVIAIERLNVHLGHPSGSSLTPSRVHALSSIRRRRPLYQLPPRPPAIIDRAPELETLYQIITGFNVADLHGPDGAGKSTLAATLVHALDLDHFPDGVVYVTGRVQHQDLLQALFESFYESDQTVKITPQHAPNYLYNLRALVILDDVGLSPKQVDPILDALGNAAVLIAGVERTAVGRGHALPLKGLALPDAIALFERALGRAPTAQERPVVEQLCSMLNGMPLPIACLAALATQNQGSLLKLHAELQSRKPWAGPGGDLAVGPALEQIVLTLDAAGRQLLTYMAAFSGPSVSSEVLRALTQLPPAEFKEQVKHLQNLGLLGIAAAKPRGTPVRLTIPPAYRQAVRTWLVNDETHEQIGLYYVTSLNRDERLVGEELPGLLGALAYCAREGWLEALKPLVYAADRSLSRLAWWAEWQHVLDLTRRAAQAAGDRALEAWATHQLGSLLGALGVVPGGRGTEIERGFHLLQTAYSMRQSLGDEAGANLSARNLEVLDSLLPAPVVERAPTLASSSDDTTTANRSLIPVASAEALPAPASSGAGKTARRRIGLVALTLLAVLALSAIALQFVFQSSGATSDPGAAGLTVSWEFGDAWNTLDNTTWTQQVVIQTTGNGDDLNYFADGQPVGAMFEVTLPLCDGAQGVIQVAASDGQTAQTAYEFFSPFCP